MNCKRCGASLPSEGYVCTSCGMLMDSEQIKVQKEFLKNKKNLNMEFVSEKYGGKKQLFQGREENNNHNFIFIFLLGCVLLIVLITVFVYFL